jgi:cytidine deaminase
MDKGMLAREAKKDAAAYPTNSGIHSEVNVVADIYRRPDIGSGLTRIAQVFTERVPCGACRAFMKNMFPAVLSTPFYYYLQSTGTERKFQTKPYGGDVMLYLLGRYGV